jgi:hypothetical protein
MKLDGQGLRRCSGTLAVAHQIVLVLEISDVKSNAIPSAQELIAAMGPSGCVRRFDAMHHFAKNSISPERLARLDRSGQERPQGHC